jgi:predicted amidophosphoribosyltransferase
MEEDDDIYFLPTYCAVCGKEIPAYEVCEDCSEQIAAEGIDPYEEDPYEEYGFDHPWED